MSTGKVVIWLLDAALVRFSGQFTNKDSAGDETWHVVRAGDYGVGALVGRNSVSGKLVVWHMDAAANRTAGVFTSPDSPATPLNRSVVGPH